MENINGRPALSLKSLRSLLAPKNRYDSGYFLVEGPRAIEQVARKRSAAIQEIVVDETGQDHRPGLPVRTVSSKQLRMLSTTRTTQGVIAVVKMPPDTGDGMLPESPGRNIILLENVQDPGNIGTLVRSAAAFGYHGVIMTEKCADPFSAKAVQASAGSILEIWIRRTSRWRGLVEGLCAKDYKLIATDAEGVRPRPLYDSHILALGNEGQGLSSWITNKAVLTIGIPINRHKAESLNVGVAGSICMFAAQLAVAQ